MINKKYILILLLLIGLFAISSVSANDLNTNNNLTAIDDSSDLIATSDTDCDSVVSAGEKIIYFDAFASTNGDGSISKPYKYVNENTLNTDSGNDITAYFAEGVYELNTPFKISSDMVLVGESRENTIFNSVLSDEYDFEIMQNSDLEIGYLTFNSINILNHGMLQAYEVTFENSESFEGDNAPSTYNTKNYNSSYGGVINCDPIDDSYPYISLENCIFENNMAFCGGAISLKNSILFAKETSFDNAISYYHGGAIYALNSNLNISDSDFDTMVALYGGSIYCEASTLYLENTNFHDTFSYSFGGALASKYSDININSCFFKE